MNSSTASLPQHVTLFNCCAEPGGPCLCFGATVCPCYVFGLIQQDLRHSVFDAFSKKETKFYVSCGLYVCVGSLFGALGSFYAPYSSTSAAAMLLNALTVNCERTEDFGATTDNIWAICCDFAKGICCGPCALSQARNQQLRAMAREDRGSRDIPHTPPRQQKMTGLRI